MRLIASALCAVAALAYAPAPLRRKATARRATTRGARLEVVVEDAAGRDVEREVRREVRGDGDDEDERRRDPERPVRVRPPVNHLQERRSLLRRRRRQRARDARWSGTLKYAKWRVG